MITKLTLGEKLYNLLKNNSFYIINLIVVAAFPLIYLQWFDLPYCNIICNKYKLLITLIFYNIIVGIFSILSIYTILTYLILLSEATLRCLLCAKNATDGDCANTRDTVKTAPKNGLGASLTLYVLDVTETPDDFKVSISDIKKISSEITKNTKNTKIKKN